MRNRNCQFVFKAQKHRKRRPHRSATVLGRQSTQSAAVGGAAMAQRTENMPACGMPSRVTAQVGHCASLAGSRTRFPNLYDWRKPIVSIVSYRFCPSQRIAYEAWHLVGLWVKVIVGAGLHSGEAVPPPRSSTKARERHVSRQPRLAQNHTTPVGVHPLTP